jgi:ZIP family zinc transporter
MRVATTTDMALAISAAANNNEWLMPLYLSSLAGASTCLGAAIVFWHPQRHKIGPNTMSFSLALAGSVMITVSVLSLGPECLRDVTSIPSSSSSNHYPFQIMPLWSSMFLERIVSFGMGCFLYWILSYFAFPDPESLVLEFSKEEEENVAREPASCHDGFLQDDASIHHNGQVHDVSSSKKQQQQQQQQRPFSVRSRKASSQALAATDSSSDRFSNDEENKGQTKTTLAQPLLLLQQQRDDDDDSYHKSPPLNNNNNKNNTGMTLSQWSSGADLQNAQQKRAWRVAMLLFCSLLIHNFPEGLAVAASSVQSTKLGMQVAFGILIHNIPEGIAIAVPCLAARPDRPWLAFLLASGSGLAEPLGAAVALLVWKNAHHRVLPMENVLSFVAGIMVTVALCELFPEAKRYDAKMYFALGTITGIGIMTATELCFPE